MHVIHIPHSETKLNYVQLYIPYSGNFGEVFNLANSVKVAKLKNHQYRLLHVAKNSDRQI